MTVAARPLPATGAFASAGMASSFNVNASGVGAGTQKNWQWNINSDGSISETVDAWNTVTTNAYPTSYGQPVAANSGRDWEAQFQMSSATITGNSNLQLFDLALSGGSYGAQNSSWVSLASAQVFYGSIFQQLSTSQGKITMSGTLAIRNKLTQQVITQSVAMTLSV